MEKECLPTDFTDWILRICWTTMLVIGFSFNSIVIYCVVKQTTKDLKRYSILLFYQALNENVIGFGFWMICIRLVNHDPIFTFASSGICGWISGRFCFEIYAICAGQVFTSVFIIPVCFCCRLYILYRQAPSMTSIIIMCILVSIPGLMYFGSLINVYGDESTTILFTNCTDKYRVFFTMRNPVTAYEQLLGNLVLLWVPAYAIAITAGILISRGIRKQSTMFSEKWAILNRKILVSLILQACVPIIDIVYFVFMQLFNNGVIQENNTGSLFFMLFGLLPVANGAVTVFFIPPYRNFLRSLFFCETKLSRVYPSTTSIQ